MKKNKKIRKESIDIPDEIEDEIIDEEVESFRKELRIHVKGADIPKPITSFYQMAINDKQIRKVILKNIEKSSI